jgi:ribosomal protein S18 acetylase RimI-like enzyme
MIEFSDSLEGVCAGDLLGFFRHWSQPPSPDTFLEILRNSDYVVLARDTVSDRVVGYITAISDGISCAYIPHLEVLEPFRGRGIGSELVRRLLGRLGDLYMVDLMCDPELQPFYVRLGFQPGSGMMRRNYIRQKCE